MTRRSPQHIGRRSPAASRPRVAAQEEGGGRHHAFVDPFVAHRRLLAAVCALRKEVAGEEHAVELAGRRAHGVDALVLERRSSGQVPPQARAAGRRQVGVVVHVEVSVCSLQVRLKLLGGEEIDYPAPRRTLRLVFSLAPPLPPLRRFLHQQAAPRPVRPHRHFRRLESRRRRASERDVNQKFIHLQLGNFAHKHVMEGDLFLIDLKVWDHLSLLLAGLLVSFFRLHALNLRGLRRLRRPQGTVNSMVVASLLHAIVASPVTTMFAHVKLHDAGSAATAARVLGGDVVPRRGDEEQVVSSSARSQATAIDGEQTAFGEGGQRLIFAALPLSPALAVPP
mmetsp:Transcript_11856/g.27347  ORF Transcript_11856/g.27347 Transcript_11856/m.27347 type:complete len:338 (-) Transcript_11856:1441-2454(-)